MKKVLFLSTLPPPHYGAAMSSEMCLGILKGTKGLEVENIKLNYSKNMSDMGKINFKKIKGVSNVRRQIEEKIKRLNPDIVYFMPATTSFGLVRDSLFVRKIKKYWKGKILFHVRSRITEVDWKNRLYRKLYKGMFKGGRAIVLDKSLKKDLRGLIENKNIFVLPNAIENEVSEKEFSEAVKLRRKKNRFDILFLSNMDESKGWFKLLQACKILREKGVKFNCNFVGAWARGKEKRKFYSYVKKNKLQEEVKYLGKKTEKEKNKILGKSDVLVFPTEFKLETFGRVVIEGMMFGLPVIANGIAAIPTTIQDGKTGFVLKENSSEEIVEKIEILLRNEKLREKMWVAGRNRFLKEYTLDSYRKKFLDIFR